jgi:DNA-binding CsgD family transcriptional regulator
MTELADVLSARERDILDRIGQGRSNKEIARELGIAPETVKSHIKNIFEKLGVDRRAHPVSRAQNLADCAKTPWGDFPRRISSEFSRLLVDQSPKNCARPPSARRF